MIAYAIYPKTDKISASSQIRILFGQPINWAKRKFPPGVCERFDKLDAPGSEQLIQMGFLKPQKTMNATPTMQAFSEFARSMQDAGFVFYLEGFTHDPAMYDGDVIIDGSPIPNIRLGNTFSSRSTCTIHWLGRSLPCIS
jgi:hypothetical protein